MSLRLLNNIYTEELSQVLNDHSLVSISDVKGRIVYANSKFCEVSGYTLAELMGADHRILKTDVHDDAFFKNMWKTIASGKKWQGEICNQAKCGRLYWVQSTIVPFLNKETNKPEQYVSIRTEITHQKKLQEKLDRLYIKALAANEAKANFLSNMTHELRTPLNHIIGFSEILEMNIKDDSLMENISYIKEAGYDLLEKIGDMLNLVDYCNLHNKKDDLIDITKLVNIEFSDYFKSLAQKSNRIFTKSIPDQEIFITADKMNILTAFRKVAENSVRFSSEGDNVGVSVSAKENIVTIAISDTGPGLPKHILTSKLEPFIIGERVVTKAKSGMGLGLPLAKKLCVQNGGKFGHEAGREFGTQIYFRFPITQPE